MTQADLREVAEHASKFLVKAINAEADEIVAADSEARTTAELLGKGPPKMPLSLSLSICPDGNVIYRFNYSIKRVIEEEAALSNKDAT